MRAIDVNVLLYAASTDFPQHDLARGLLVDALSGPEPVGLPSPVLSGFIRIATSRTVLPRALCPVEAWSFLDALTSAPSARVLVPGPRHWSLFRGLCQRYETRGADITDTYLAALAIEQNATWVSFDRGFARFRELAWVDPTDPA